MKVIVVGGGAAGFFAAIAAAGAGLRPGVYAPEGSPRGLSRVGAVASDQTYTPQGKEVMLLEKSPQFLTKVRISGGGRCNVTHACFDARDFTKHYPRGEKALIGAFQKFQASDTVAWFAARGVKLKTESDGRMFPTTDSSQTIMDCLLGEAKAAGVKLVLN